MIMSTGTPPRLDITTSINCIRMARICSETRLVCCQTVLQRSCDFIFIVCFLRGDGFILLWNSMLPPSVGFCVVTDVFSDITAVNSRC